MTVIKTIDLLDKGGDSPWKDMLLMPDEMSKEHPDKIAHATSAITSIRPIYSWLEEFGLLAGMNFDEKATKLASVLGEYWRALEAVVPGAFATPEEYVIQKTPGFFSLHMILRDRLLPRIYMGRREWDQETFE